MQIIKRVSYGQIIRFIEDITLREAIKSDIWADYKIYRGYKLDSGIRLALLNINR